MIEGSISDFEADEEFLKKVIEITIEGEDVLFTRYDLPQPSIDALGVPRCSRHSLNARAMLTELMCRKAADLVKLWAKFCLRFAEISPAEMAAGKALNPADLQACRLAGRTAG